MVHRGGDPRRTFQSQRPGYDGGHGDGNKTGQGPPQRGDVAAGPERGAPQPQEAGHHQGDDGTGDAARPQQVQCGDSHQGGLAHEVGPALAAPDAAGQHEQAQTTQRGQSAGGLRHRQGQELAQDVEVVGDGCR